MRSKEIDEEHGNARRGSVQWCKNPVRPWDSHRNPPSTQVQHTTEFHHSEQLHDKASASRHVPRSLQQIRDGSRGWPTTASPAGRRTTPGGWARAPVSTRLDDLWLSLWDAAFAITLALMRRAHYFSTFSDAPRGHIVRGPPSLFRLSVQLRAVVCDSCVMRSMEHSDSLPVSSRQLCCIIKLCSRIWLGNHSFWKGNLTSIHLRCSFWYVLNAGRFWQSRDARHRLMCDKTSWPALARCKTMTTHPISCVRVTRSVLQQGLQAHESGPIYLVHPTRPARGTCSPRFGPPPPQMTCVRPPAHGRRSKLMPVRQSGLQYMKFSLVRVLEHV